MLSLKIRKRDPRDGRDEDDLVVIRVDGQVVGRIKHGPRSRMEFHGFDIATFEINRSDVDDQKYPRATVAGEGSK